MENNNSVFSMETEQYRNYLLKCAASLTKNMDDAEDLVQETYVRAFRYFHTYQLGSNCRSWLYKIMKNLFLNYAKVKKKKESTVTRFDEYEFLLHYEPKNFDNSLSDFLILSVNRIKDDYRILIILFYLESYSLKEISEFLNWPLGTVKSRLHRARAELRNLIN